MPVSSPMLARAAFSGLRLQFMEEQLEGYATAVVESRDNDFVLDVQRRYFKRFPLSLSHDVEPSQESLDSVNDNTSDPELQEPNQKDMSDEEYKDAKSIFDHNCALLHFRKDIRRWLKYHHGKKHPLKSVNAAGKSLPAFVAQLVGCDVKKPHKPTPYNQWAKVDANKSKIQKEFDKAIHQQDIPRTQHLKARGDITRRLFQALPMEQQQWWTKRMEEEYQRACEEYEERLNSGPSTSPEDHQRCIDNLPRLLQPILDLVHDYTGMQVTALIGGPEPADKGHLNVIGMHAGGIPGPVRMNFGQAFRKDYREVIIPLFGQYLKHCYTREECRSRAIPAETSFHHLDSVNESDINFDSVGWGSSASAPTAIPQGSSVLVTQPCLSTPPMDQHWPSPTPLGRLTLPSQPTHILGLPQPPLSTPTTPTPSDLLSSPLRSLSSGSYPLTPARNFLLHEREPDPGRSSLPVTTVPPFNHLNESSRPVQSTQPLGRVSSANTAFEAVPPSLEGLLMVGPLINEKREMRLSGEFALECRKRRREQPAPLFEKPPAKVASPPRPRPRLKSQKEAITMRPSSSAGRPPSLSTSAPSQAISSQVDSLRSARNFQSWEGRGHTHDTMKRRKTSPTRLPDPVVQDVCKLFLSADFGKAWLDTVHDFQNFESLHPSNPKAKLSSVNRPVCVHEWIKRKRSGTYRPDADALSKIPQDFNSWWRALQPEWRLLNGNKALKKANGDWSKLRISGTNGFLSVMAALFFWRLSLKSPDDVGWNEALDDVGWALQCMVKTAVS